MSKVVLKWSKKQNEFIAKYPAMQNRNGSIVAKAFLYMMTDFEKSIKNDLRTYLTEGGFDADSFTITVKVKKP